MASIAKELGISGQRVSQIINRTIRKLRHPRNAKLLKDYHYDI